MDVSPIETYYYRQVNKLTYLRDRQTEGEKNDRFVNHVLSLNIDLVDCF